MANTEKERQVLREFGRRVRVARDAHGWTQEELAYEADVDRTYVGSVERGEINLTLSNLNKLALALGENFSGFLPYRVP